MYSGFVIRYSKLRIPICKKLIQYIARKALTLTRVLGHKTLETAQRTPLRHLWNLHGALGELNTIYFMRSPGRKPRSTCLEKKPPGAPLAARARNRADGRAGNIFQWNLDGFARHPARSHQLHHPLRDVAGENFRVRFVVRQGRIKVGEPAAARE